MKKSVLSLFFACMLFVVSCSDNSERITVASARADCVGVAPQKCYLIKENDQDEWTFLYSEIEGFNYEPGYEYVIRIKKENRANPAQDQSSIRYIFVKEVSKTRKTSENMPVTNRTEIY